MIDGQLRYSEYRASTKLKNKLFAIIPDLDFFDKEGYKIDATLRSNIEFEYRTPDYVYLGIVNLFYGDKAPVLLIKAKERSTDVYHELPCIIRITDTSSKESFVISPSYIKENGLHEEVVKVTFGNSIKEIKPGLDGDYIELSDDVVKLDQYTKFMQDRALPSVNWSVELQTEQVPVEFISSEAIRVFQKERDSDGNFIYVENEDSTKSNKSSNSILNELSDSADGTIIESPEPNITTYDSSIREHSYIEPFATLIPKKRSYNDKSIPNADLFKTYSKSFIEFPNLLLSTTRTDENFLIDVDYTNERLNKVPFKIHSPFYLESELDLGISQSEQRASLIEKLKKNPYSEKYLVEDFSKRWHNTEAKGWDQAIGNILAPSDPNEEIKLSGSSKKLSEDEIRKNRIKYRPASFHIGISSPEEGIYYTLFDLYILIERVSLDDFEIAEEDLGYTLDTLYIGTFSAYTKITGYDHRFRTFFENFGIPDPIEYPTIFKQIDPKEDYPNADIVNQKSKELFLSYKDIFPYAGTYKALLNAVKFLGYDDLFFREWYKTNDISSKNKNELVNYVGLDVKKGLTTKDKISSVNIDFESYLNLIKLNRLSMVYQFNKEHGEDEFGVPGTIDVYDYKNDDILVKLYSVREWLERHIIGVNCRITDLTGEGIYFQRFESVGYPNSITNFDVGSHVNLTPKAYKNEYFKTLSDSTLSADVNVTLSDYEHTTIEDIEDKRIVDFVYNILDLRPQGTTTIVQNGVNITGVLKFYVKDPLYEYKDKYGFLKPVDKEKKEEEDKKDNKIEDRVDLSSWDVNDSFQIPLSARLDCPVLYNSITYNIENQTENGAFYHSLKKTKLSADDIKLYKKEQLKKKYQYKSFEKGNAQCVDPKQPDCSNYAFTNSIILDNNELKLLEADYLVSYFKDDCLPSFRVKSGKLRRLGYPLNRSSIYSMEPISTEDGQVRYSLSREEPLTNVEGVKSKKFTLDTGYVLSDDYFTFVPNRSKTPSCRFEYVKYLDAYYFIVSGYKIQLTSDSDQSKAESKKDTAKPYNNRAAFQKEIRELDEFIIDIFDGSIISEIREPLIVGAPDDPKSAKVYLTEELDFQLMLSVDETRDFINRSFIYKYIRYDVPVFSYANNNTLTDIHKNLLAKTTNKFISTDPKSDPNQYLEEAKKSIKSRTQDILDKDSFDKTRYLHYSSKEESDFANITQQILDESILVNDKIEFTVNHAGDYKIEAYAVDNYNNTYLAESKLPVSVTGNKKDVWVGSQFLNQAIDPTFNNEVDPHQLDKILKHEDYTDLTNDDKKKLTNYQDLWTNMVKSLGDFESNLYPKYPKLERYSDLKFDSITNKIVTYENRPYELDGPSLLFSNITDSARELKITWDSASIGDSRILEKENEYPEGSRIGKYILTFFMSYDNMYKNKFDTGSKWSCVFYDTSNYQYLGCLDNLYVNSFYKSKVNEISDDTLIMEVNIDEETRSNMATLYRVKSKKNIRFYFIRSQQYTVVNYVNHIDSKTADIKIKVSAKDTNKFKNGDIIKLRKATCDSYKVLHDDKKNKVAVLEVIPTYDEVSYKVVNCEPFRYTIVDKNTEFVEIVDKNYQIVTVEGFVDLETTAKVNYNDAIFGKKSREQNYSEAAKNDKRAQVQFIPYPSRKKNGPAYTDLINAYNRLVTPNTKNGEQGFMTTGTTISERKKSSSYETFLKKYASKNSKPPYPQPGKTIYLKRVQPNSPVQGSKGPSRKGENIDNRPYIVYLKLANKESDLFIQSILSDENDIFNMQSFINRLLTDYGLLDVTLMYAHDRFVEYQFDMLNRKSRKGITTLTLDDPYLVYDYLDTNYSFISCDFNLRKADDAWSDYSNYYKYNVRFYNKPTVVENNSDFILFSRPKNLETDKNYFKYITNWEIYRAVAGSDNEFYRADKLLYRFNNDTLFLTSLPNCLYSIILNTVDEFGNKVQTVKSANIKTIENN